MRIAVPLLLFWLILCPVMMYQYNVAGIQSGAIQGDESAWGADQNIFRGNHGRQHDASSSVVSVLFVLGLCHRRDGSPVGVSVRSNGKLAKPNRVDLRATCLAAVERVRSGRYLRAPDIPHEGMLGNRHRP